MILTENQISQILSIIDYHHLFVMTTNFGKSGLTEMDKIILKSFGIDIDVLPNIVPYDMMYMFGVLAASLTEDQAKIITANDFLSYVKSGEYFPLTSLERETLEISRKQTYVHLKGLRDRAKGQAETIIYDNEKQKRQAYEDAIKQGISEGVARRKTVSEVISDLGHKMNDWKHDWGRIVETEMNNVYQLGIANKIKQKRGADARVYKQVYPQACRHCIRLYLTDGLGSEPRIFKLSELEANGTNIGLPVAEWKPIIGSTHPYCRCHLYDMLPGYEWDKTDKRFNPKKDFQRKVERKSKVKVTVGEKVFEV